MSLSLLLVRHGETPWNRERRFQGFSDVPLNERGMRQACALARCLRARQIAAVYASDLVRARSTAETIAREHGVEVRVDARLREMNQGALEGKALEDLLRDYPGLLERWLAEPAEVRMPGGESLRCAQDRAWEVVQEIRTAFSEGTIVLVGHNLCLLAVICRAVGLDLNHFRRLRIENASITEILFSGAEAVLLRLNDTRHLEEQLREDDSR